MKKRLILVAVAVVLVLALGACGNSSAKDKDAGGAASQSGEETENTITGTVSDGGMSSTTIATDDGKVITFSTDNSMFDMKDGLLIGDVVKITYKGTIGDDGDTAGVTVIKVTDGADNSGNPFRLDAEKK